MGVHRGPGRGRLEAEWAGFRRRRARARRATNAPWHRWHVRFDAPVPRQPGAVVFNAPQPHQPYFVGWPDAEHLQV